MVDWDQLAVKLVRFSRFADEVKEETMAEHKKKRRTNPAPGVHPDGDSVPRPDRRLKPKKHTAANLREMSAAAALRRGKKKFTNLDRDR